MLTALASLKAIGGPGSLGFLGVALLVGVCLMYLWPRQRRLGWTWFGATAVLYIVLSLPVTASAFAAQLPDVDASTLPRHGLDTLVILSGDNAQGRVGAALRIYAEISPARVWLLGDDEILMGLVSNGIPRTRILYTTLSGNTLSQMDEVAALAARTGADRHLLIASRFQMPRIKAILDKRGSHPMLFASPADREWPTSGLKAYVPTFGALMGSRDVVYELAALRYYRMRGWI